MIPPSSLTDPQLPLAPPSDSDGRGCGHPGVLQPPFKTCQFLGRSPSASLPGSVRWRLVPSLTLHTPGRRSKPSKHLKTWNSRGWSSVLSFPPLSSSPSPVFLLRPSLGPSRRDQRGASRLERGLDRGSAGLVGTIPLRALLLVLATRQRVVKIEETL